MNDRRPRLSTPLHSALFAAALLGGCANIHEPEVLPGIAADARLVDLTEEQHRTLCLFLLDIVGGDPENGGSRWCTGGHWFGVNGLSLCIEDGLAMRMLYPDCPTLVRSEVNFWLNIRDNCDSPDFDPANYQGRRACSGP